jgi:hypothetical protein
MAEKGVMVRSLVVKKKGSTRLAASIQELYMPGLKRARPWRGLSER